MTTIGFGAVGVGAMGHRHAENLARRVPGARLAAVTDTDQKRSRLVAAELGAEHEPSLEALLGRRDVEAVVIALPPRHHAPAVQAAAAAGKHILCEKPLALTTEDADAAVLAARRAGVALQIGFMRRYDRAYASAKRRIESGEIGDPVIFKSLGRDKDCPPFPAAVYGTDALLLYGSSIHEFDLARWLMADEVAEVHAYGAVIGYNEQPPVHEIDAGVVNLRYRRGMIGQVESFRYAAYGYDIRTEIVGTRGTIQVGYLRQTAEVVLTQAGVSHDAVDHWLVRFADAYLAQMIDFVETLRAGREPRITGEDGRAAVAIAAAADRSYHEQRPVAVAGCARTSHDKHARSPS